ncbi:peptidase S8/S53 domain-containing protein [Chytriomyces cf. hyalinus JEL632]|nr:peptidase S8/S53 domain-containing protein [Chytriomyces cf. hyalinus JEL632]
MLAPIRLAFSSLFRLHLTHSLRSMPHHPRLRHILPISLVISFFIISSFARPIRRLASSSIQQSPVPVPANPKVQWVLTLIPNTDTDSSQSTALDSTYPPSESLEARARSFAQSSGINFLGQVGSLQGTFLYEANDAPTATNTDDTNLVQDDMEGRVNLDQNMTPQSPFQAQTVMNLALFKELATDFFGGGFMRVAVDEQTPMKRFKRKCTMHQEFEVRGDDFMEPETMKLASLERKMHLGNWRKMPSAAAQPVTKSIAASRLAPVFNDPNFRFQWNLYNDGQSGRIKGNDINVLPVWERGINGSGVTVVILDDGIEFSHPDFHSNTWSSESSWDFNNQSPNPVPEYAEDVHGTRCAGQIVSAPNNNVCGVGVAYGAKLAGERLLAESTTDAIEAQALNFKNQINDIYSSSWGPDDDGGSLDGPGKLASAALEAGVRMGRGGKGSIFVFASGNGGREKDNCNFDGYANSIYTVGIGAINHKGEMPVYGEVCAAHLAVTYSGGAGHGIWTTDVNGECTGVHSGTSATAPIASGIIALMLSARPQLRWRDVQQLIVQTAQPTHQNDADWQINGAQRSVSHKYGFGRLDADKLVHAATHAQLLPTGQAFFSKATKLHGKDAVIASSSSTPSDMLLDTLSEIPFTTRMVVSLDDLMRINSTLASIEHVQVTVRLTHPRRGSLALVLVSPAGTRSILATPRPNDNSQEGFNPWTFMTVMNWGESPIGEWVLHIYSQSNSTIPLPHHGILSEWSLNLFGNCDEYNQDLDSITGERTCVSVPRSVPTLDKKISSSLSDWSSELSRFSSLLSQYRLLFWTNLSAVQYAPMWGCLFWSLLISRTWVKRLMSLE